MKKFLKIAFIIILLFCALIMRSVYASGFFKTITNSFSGTTQKIEGVVGTEDITIDQSTGIAFLSCDDRWAHMADKPVKGGIFTLNLNDTILKPVNKTLDFPQEDFHPHGISLYQTGDGKKRLFVVNHRKSGNFIEIFDYKNDSLQHRESISDPLLASPNDIVGVGERAFYVTNDHNEGISTSRSIKDLLLIGSGNVCYFDGQKMQKTGIEGLKYANGINISADGKQLFVAETSGKRINVYDRNIQTSALKKVDEMNCDTGVDNIEWGTEGSLWVGCHPKMLKFLSHSKSERTYSPSEIIQIRYKGKGNFEQKTVYMNDGSEISGSAVGAVYKDKLLLGPVFQKHIIVASMQ